MGTGALFYKADLHIHSYGEGVGSYDVEDTTNTPSAIVDTAILKGLKVISITDHNEILNSIAAVQYAADKEILVISNPRRFLQRNICSIWGPNLLMTFSKPESNVIWANTPIPPYCSAIFRHSVIPWLQIDLPSFIDNFP